MYNRSYTLNKEPIYEAIAGVTTNALVDVIRLNTYGKKGITITLENRADIGLNPMNYQLWTNPAFGVTGGDYLENSGTLNVGDVKKFILSKDYGQVFLRVVATVAGAFTTYRGGYIALLK